MGAVVVLAVGLLVASCGRRNFNDDAGVDATVPTCAPPPTGCTNGNAYICGDVCYVSCTNSASRPAAAVTCEAWGGCLATIESQTANNCVASQAPEQAWIGALQDNNVGAPADGWRWCDGNLISFQRWMSGAPDDQEGIEGGDEQCAVVLPSGDWFDASCNGLRRFTCSRPL